MIRSFFTAIYEIAKVYVAAELERDHLRASALVWRIRAERAEAELRSRDLVRAEHYAQQSYGRWGAN
jgi:hypothetical protein